MFSSHTLFRFTAFVDVLLCKVGVHRYQDENYCQYQAFSGVLVKMPGYEKPVPALYVLKLLGLDCKLPWMASSLPSSIGMFSLHCKVLCKLLAHYKPCKNNKWIWLLYGLAFARDSCCTTLMRPTALVRLPHSLCSIKIHVLRGFVVICSWLYCAVLYRNTSFKQQVLGHCWKVKTKLKWSKAAFTEPLAEVTGHCSGKPRYVMKRVKIVKLLEKTCSGAKDFRWDKGGVLGNCLKVRYSFITYCWDL